MTDEQLIQSWRETRNESDLRELWNRHFDQVRWLVLCGIDHTSPFSDAMDDLVQEIMIKVARNLDQFEGKSQFSTWLYRITINTVHSYRTSRKNKRAKYLSEDNPPTSKKEDGPDKIAEFQELKTAIQVAIQNLSPSLRNAISLIAIQGLSPEEAAEIEQCTVSSIYRRLHDARKILKEQLRPYFS